MNSFCSSCGSPIQDRQVYCANCGARQDGAVGLVTPNPVALPPAGVLLRCLAAFLDMVVIFLIGFAVALPLGQTSGDGFELKGFGALLFWIIIFAYFVIFEMQWGATPGKMLTGLKVLRTDGQAAGLREAVIRTASRIIDYFFLIGIIIMAISSKNQRLGDRLAETMVVKSKNIKLKQVNNNGYQNFDD